MGDYREVKELFEQINSHPGLQYYRALIRHKFSQNILASNTASLRQYLILLESGEIEEKSNPQEAKLQWLELDQQLLRELHNFAASAATLIDHTRELMKSSMIRLAHRERYQHKVNATFDTPVAHFVKQFRNYIVHCGPPKTSQITTINPSEIPDTVITIVLDWEPMRGWSGWNDKTRAFMDARPSSARILPLVEEYLKVVAEFHTWFVQDFLDEYRNELAELKELQSKFSPTGNSSA